MSDSICRWGILSTANIARKNWKGIRLSGNGVVAGVSSRDLDRANQYIDECQREVPFDERPVAFGSHQALLDSDAIDAVYVPLPTGLRKQWVIAAANAKKHVLIEKPIADTAADAKEMLDACKANNVQLMDGVMYDHSKRIVGLRDAVAEGQIGNIRRIQAHFSFTGDKEFQSGNIRTDAKLERHGCLGDLGWYCIRLILWTMNWKAPSKVSGRTIKKLSREGVEGWVPGEFQGELIYDDGPSASFFCSFLSFNQQTATISGDEGYISLDDYVLPLYGSQSSFDVNRHDLQIDNCRWNFRRMTETRTFDEFHSGEPNSQEVAMVRRFADQVLRKEIDQDLLRRAMLTQQILDACRTSDEAGGGLIDFNES
ncbi:Gfo/Idh/MocA family protein [Rhodopirellula sp. MGV]|uniref:Gfo/Idh/MocA family protein n=1 Tax=Rhodopirellula sp. MGV TaxID=2023130 RepID=UPI000B96861D|nr:Gfo/Idh/MocA family oxidoreductase [Rhodopirellula sp. MGV]OYP37970.1 oxidoreductase [Rhodopirellula sp. MGV]PNY34272.1 gfo/Idh/MocA family oxidoreductase [Rhodopirellula baltica]